MADADETGEFRVQLCCNRAAACPGIHTTTFLWKLFYECSV